MKRKLAAQSPSAMPFEAAAAAPGAPRAVADSAARAPPVHALAIYDRKQYQRNFGPWEPEEPEEPWVVRRVFTYGKAFS